MRSRLVLINFAMTTPLPKWEMNTDGTKKSATRLSVRQYTVNTLKGIAAFRGAKS